MRIGFACDIHKLTRGRKLVLGGVMIPFPFGEEAHSDGDVLLHAIAEAILGALALGDLGTFFPDSDERFKDIESKYILLEVVSIMEKEGYKIANIDTNIYLETPKLGVYKQKIKENVAKLLNLNDNQISIKAGTNEGFDAIGRGEAIKADAIVLLERK